MFPKRVIPCLLIDGDGLVKTFQFKNSKYVGDPINAVKIFNEKEVDELVVLDISKNRHERGPNFDLISKLTSECFMPLSYGGGITKYEHAEKLFGMGVEKVCINSAFDQNPDIIKKISSDFGSQAVVVSMDIKKNLWGKYKVATHSGSHNTNLSPLDYARKAQAYGAGEIFLNSIDRDGMQTGYDLELIKTVSEGLDIPIVACGGAKDFDDFKKGIQIGASAVAAGSFFVFHGKHKAVLISYPDRQVLDSLIKSE